VIKLFDRIGRSIKFTDVGRHFVVEARVREHGSGTRYVPETVLANLGIARSDITIALEFPSNESTNVRFRSYDVAQWKVIKFRIAICSVSRCGKDLQGWSPEFNPNLNHHLSSHRWKVMHPLQSLRPPGAPP